MKTLELLSLNGLCHIVGVPQDTAANWIEDFNFYIPETKQKDITYFQPEAINVLQFIKECKNQNYRKQRIMEMLANEEFPVTVEKTNEDVSQSLNQENYKENILTVMQTIGKTVANVSDQRESIKALQDQQDEQNKRIKNTEKQSQEISHIKQEMKALKQEKYSPGKEYEMKKKSFAELFAK